MIDEINEELSVSEDVRDAVDKIKRAIQDEIGNDVEKYSYYNRYFYNMCLEIFDTIIYLNLCVVPFVDKLDFSKNKELYSFDCEIRYSRDNVCDIILNIPIINKCIYRYYLDDNLSHELRHYYEYLKRGRRLSLTNQKDIINYNSLYAKVKSGIYTKKEKDVAMCLYYSYRFERSAFAHGLDGILSQYRESHEKGKRNIDEIYDIFKTTDEYKYMSIMHDVLEHLSDYTAEILRIAKMSTDKFENILRKRYIEFRNAMHKVLMKTYEELNGLDGISIMFD